jgi:hypothetical protein
MIFERFSEPYFIDGDMLYHRGRVAVTKVCSIDEPFAVLYDSRDGLLLKHGPAKLVAEYGQNLGAAFASSPIPELARDLMLISFSITRETIEEVNACIQITGRITGFQERMRGIVEGVCDGPTLH